MTTYSGPSKPSSTSQATSLLPGQATLLALVTAAFAVPAVLVLVLVCAVVPGLAWWVGILVGIMAAVAIVAVLVRGGADACLRELGAEPADPKTYARYYNLVQGLSLSGGIAEPELYVIDDEARNAACIAGGDRTAIVVTTGLLGAVDRIGLEGLMAVAVVRLRSGDAAAATLGATLFGRLFKGVGGKLGEPMASFGLKHLVNADRDLAVDREAVRLTRYPPGLLVALTAVRQGTVKPAVWGPGNGHLWLVPPSAAEARSVSMVQAAPLDLRIDVLAEF